MTDAFRVIRGQRQVISVDKDATAADIVNAAKEKFACHDCDFPSSVVHTLHYPDGREVFKLPAGDDIFTLRKYKEQLLKDYLKIILYIVASGNCYCNAANVIIYLITCYYPAASSFTVKLISSKWDAFYLRRHHC